MNFFQLKPEDKEDFKPKHSMDPISWGNNYDDTSKVSIWREYLRVYSYPEFNFPIQPSVFSEVSSEFCKKVREVAMELLKVVIKNLGIEEGEMKQVLDLDKGLQMLVINEYKLCPRPGKIGIPAHTDHGLLTLLMQNGVEGLQVEHDGEWVTVNEIPNAFIVNVADQLEIFSNGKYKSVMHRAVVHEKEKRISMAMTHGPSLDTFVGPYSNLIKTTNQQPKYKPMQYKEYMEQQVVLGNMLPHLQMIF